MKAAVLKEIGAPLVIEERADLSPGPSDVVVRLNAASLNRRDYWITKGMYPGIEPPVVLGSDGAGIVIKVGKELGNYWIDRDVIINPGTRWGNDPSAQSKEFTILGLPDDGTFATEVLVPATQLHAKPEHLSWEQASALPLAGVTAYRAVFTQGHLQPGERMLVSGIGGGVASFALQFGIAAGAEVWVTSSSEQKIQSAIELGAAGGFNYKESGWSKTMSQKAGAPNLIIDSAGGDGYGELLNLAASGGRIVNYGATAGPPKQVDLFKVFWKQLRIQGTTMGSPDDFAAMLDFVTQHRLAPIVDDVVSLENINNALDAMHRSSQFGKIVVSLRSD